MSGTISAACVATARNSPRPCAVTGGSRTLHRSLDLTYREDESRVRNRTFAENLSWLRRLPLGLIKHHSGKQGNSMKRRRAGWSLDVLMQVITAKET